ncbi:MAG: aldehyde dehydrogenase family protein [Eubacteriales bacterium]|nr:aldehyde dehydrogenase family protein [Eubacteriales bacterium]
MELQEIIKSQNEFFETGATRNPAIRIAALKKLYDNIVKNESDIRKALYEDLNKDALESMTMEIGITLSEISYMLKNINKLSKPKRRMSPLSHMPSHLMEYCDPYGTVLIIAPWNFPFLLSITPLIDAIAAGNTCIIKPSAKAPATKAIIKKLLDSSFPENYVYTVEGGREQNANLLDFKYDYIFFTGSKSFGREIMKKASEHLCPITLELGGKSPCIVDKSCNLEITAKRTVFGKLTNAGQVCVAPDYFLVHEDIVQDFIKTFIERTEEIYTKDPINCPYYPKIITEKDFNQVLGRIDKEKTIYGGKFNRENLKIEPTIIYPATLADKCMQEENFGPIVPIIPFSSYQDTLKIINAHPEPLALYVFAEDKNVVQYYMQRVRFGGGCINDTLMHVGTHKIGFGGVGQSGMGLYHGKYGFDTFTHRKGVVVSSTRFDIPVRYVPNTKNKMRIIKRLMR